MDLTKLREINALQADKNLAAVRHEENIAHTDNVAQTVLSATSALIKYLEGHTSKTEVVNQLESISTPDVKYVVEALQVLDQTLQKLESTDLSEVTGVMRELLNEARQIPKELPQLPEPAIPIDYTKQFSSMLEAIKGVEKVVKAQKLVAEAPVVHVPEPTVHVQAPDLDPITTSIKKLDKTVVSGQAEVVDGAMQTQDISNLITENYNRFTITRRADEFSATGEKLITAITYYQDKEQVAKLVFRYSDGEVSEVKKV